MNKDPSSVGIVQVEKNKHVMALEWDEGDKSTMNEGFPETW